MVISTVVLYASLICNPMGCWLPSEPPRYRVTICRQVETPPGVGPAPPGLPEFRCKEVRSITPPPPPRGLWEN